ncbi:MAG: hypothetical protein ABSF26_18390 [Thermoguttaceae bacterium]|jgi:hypothetical protein
MAARLFLAAMITSALAGPAVAEDPAPPTFAASAALSPAAGQPPRHSAVRVSTGTGTLPNEQGQVWREYDISPYTARVTTTKRPEQAMVDWILRETGYEAWHGEPLSVLSATPRTLRVYHTPQVQAVVADLVERFVASEAETSTFSLRLMTVDNPSWRAAAQRILRSVPVQTPGVCAWVLPKEDAAVLLAQLQRRPDYREHSAPHLLVASGQSTVVSGMRPRTYLRDFAPRPGAWQGLESQPGQVDEGFVIEFSPLVALDRRTIDAAIRCEINQVEKLLPVMLEVATTASPRQRAKIDVPQVSQFRFHERFRWPVDQVLLVGLGVVPLPVPADNALSLAGVPLPLPSAPPRADLLVLVESKGR